jgi:hypothetical protein
LAEEPASNERTQDADDYRSDAACVHPADQPLSEQARDAADDDPDNDGIERHLRLLSSNPNDRAIPLLFVLSSH